MKLGAICVFLHAILVHLLCFALGEYTEVTLATYNIWNIMFNWEVRKFRIAQMIKEVKADVIAFQEVRADILTNINQLQELQKLLPQYQWFHFQPANQITQQKGAYVKGWEIEGIGILSKHPLSSVSTQNLSYSRGPDRNKRVVLHTMVVLPTGVGVHVSVTHFSYDRHQQCQNAIELFGTLHEKNHPHSIILGDFNTYTDFDWPLKLLTHPEDTGNKCVFHANKLHDTGRREIKAFDDAWDVVHPGKPGLTFSNMPQPGKESRPDRILATSDTFKVISADVLGDGTTYRRKFFIHVLANRLERVLNTVHAAYIGEKGRSCLHDCGPHASCRCGVCVSGGDGNTCELPSCEECSPVMYKYILVSMVIFVALAAQLISGILKVLHGMNDRGHNSILPQFVCTKYCCLCDTRLYIPQMSSGASKRKSRLRILQKIWPVLQLPPMLLVIVSLLMLVVFVQVILHVFGDLVTDVYGILPEELNPSDHLMVVAKLQLLPPQ